MAAHLYILEPKRASRAIHKWCPVVWPPILECWRIKYSKNFVMSSVVHLHHKVCQWWKWFTLVVCRENISCRQNYCLFTNWKSELQSAKEDMSLTYDGMQSTCGVCVCLECPRALFKANKSHQEKAVHNNHTNILLEPSFCTCVSRYMLHSKTDRKDPSDKKYMIQPLKRKGFISCAKSAATIVCMHGTYHTRCKYK